MFFPSFSLARPISILIARFILRCDGNGKRRKSNGYTDTKLGWHRDNLKSRGQIYTMLLKSVANE